MPLMTTPVPSIQGASAGSSARRWPPVVIAAVLLAAAALTGCGGSSPTHGDPSVPSLLRDVPTNAETRADIVINNLQALRTSVGLPADAIGNDVDARELNAMRHDLVAGTPLGWSLLDTEGPGSGAPLGYDPLRAGAELGVGEPPDSVSIVNGAFNAASVGHALTTYGWTRRRLGAASVYAGATNLRSPLAPALSTLREIAVTPTRLVGAGPGVSAHELTAVAAMHPVSHSLASDPQVAATLRLLGPIETLEMGTSLVATPLRLLGGASASPQQRQELLMRLGIQDLPRALFAGYALKDGGSWRAVMLYSSARDAARAVPIIARVFHHGISPVRNVPYARLAQPISIRADGTAVVTTLSHSSDMAQMIANADFPPLL